jgi:two-component system chemotaxis sensor kinase CheA
VLFESLDVLRALADLIERNGSEKGAGNVAPQLVEKIQQTARWLRDGTEPKRSTPHRYSREMPSEFDEVPQSESLERHSDDATAFDEIAAEREQFKPSAEEEALMQALTREMAERFVTEALESVTRAEELCLALEQEPMSEELTHALFGVMHTIKGNAGFMGYAEIERIASDAENILEAVRGRILSVSPNLISGILTSIDAIKNAVLMVDGGGGANPVNEDAADIVAHEFVNGIHVADNLQAVSSQPFTKTTTNGHAQADASTDVLTDVSTDTASKLAFTNAATNAVQTALIRKKDIRVDTEKLDMLFDLIGELITVETMVSNHPDVTGLDAPNFHKSTRMLNKITRELQEVSTALRMMPLDGLFKRMQRLVRDLSLKFQKNVRLELAGAETEMDKNVIEDIADPLMHILRNAMDHGLETDVAERVARGKPEQSMIRLGARYDHNSILITVEDDGRGLQREKILKKAVAKGLVRDVSTHALERLADTEVWAFIFEPGFSTAEQVSDTSGRGVGMDVVKKNIERLQGSIRVESRAGFGTRFLLRIPLTLAIMEAMLIRVGAVVYALPILSIRHSFRPAPDRITTTMDGLELVRVREDIFPIIRLHEFFQIRHSETALIPLQEGILVTVESHERTACLFVDEILGQQQIVVKGLTSYIGSVRGVMGCMILANGEIGLIVDVDAVIASFEGVAQT